MSRRVLKPLGLGAKKETRHCVGHQGLSQKGRRTCSWTGPWTQDTVEVTSEIVQLGKGYTFLIKNQELDFRETLLMNGIFFHTSKARNLITN